MADIKFADHNKLTVLVYPELFRTLEGMKTSHQLSREAVDEFKAAYLQEFGMTLQDDEVQEIAMRLLRFFDLLTGPDRSHCDAG